MKTINVSICTGTTCYLMGAAHLLTFDEELDPCSLDYVDIKGARCLGLCHDEANGKPPFAKVGDHVIADATITKMIERVHALIEEGD